MAVAAINDWETTNACTFRPPFITPGYTGYLPQVRFSYGDTFGNDTSDAFQKRRYKIFASSQCAVDKANLPPIDQYPTTNSNNPDLVLADRKRTRERWNATQKYRLTREGTKEHDMQVFLQLCQQHRHHYKDQTGTVKRVEVFVLPRLSRVKDDIEASSITENMADRTALLACSCAPFIGRKFRGTQRQRAIRDMIFEKR